MTRMWIVVGDLTSGGGRVITGSPFTDVDGKPVARIGDKATCPKCKGTFPIVSGDPTTIIDGQPVARHGDSLACGCKVMSVQQTRVFVGSGASGPRPSRGATSESNHTLTPAAGPAIPPQFDHRFQLTDELTGVPLAGQPYRLTGAGATVEGVTDADGFTESLPTGTSSADVVCTILGVGYDDLG